MFRTPISSWQLAVGSWREKLRTVRLLPPTANRQPPTDTQQGFTLAALIVILTIISIVVAYTVPTQWSMVMKRERDRQTIFLMKQYARGILAWQTKHNNTAPTSLEQMFEARKPRLIRGVDIPPMPLTGKAEDWILVPPQALMPAGMPGVGGPQPTNPATSGRPPQQPVPGVPGMPGAMKLNKDLSPPDYKGPFVAVRPNFTGPSFIALNDAENYEEWVYTVDDLRAEISMRQAALVAR